jgi:hypothetical protein
VWKRGLLGKALEEIFSMSCLKVKPFSGSGLSRTKFAVSFHVNPVHRLELIAACPATKDAYFAF